MVKVLIMIFLTFFSFSANAIEIVDGPKVKWNLSMWGKPRAGTAGLEAISEYMDKRTNGKFKIKVHYGAALSKPRENLDGIKLGAFQMAMFCSVYHAAKVPTITALDLPFLPFTSLNVQAKVHDAYYKHPAVIKDLARWDAKYLLSTLVPEYEFSGTGEPPLTLADWSGKRVRAPGGIGKAMKKLGAIPTTVTSTETYTALERGTVDTVAFPWSYAHVAFKILDVATWYTANLTPGTVNCPVVMDIKAWKKLPRQYQDLLQEAKMPAYKALIGAYEEADTKNMPIIESKKLTKIVYSPAEISKFRAIAAKPLWDDWIKSANENNIPGQELFDLIMTTANH